MDTWEDKAEWLRSNGYDLVIEALGQLFEEDFKWMASLGGESRRYGMTIGEAVEQVYDLVVAEQHD